MEFKKLSVLKRNLTFVQTCPLSFFSFFPAKVDPRARGGLREARHRCHRFLKRFHDCRVAMELITVNHHSVKVLNIIKITLTYRKVVMKPLIGSFGTHLAAFVGLWRELLISSLAWSAAFRTIQDGFH